MTIIEVHYPVACCLKTAAPLLLGHSQQLAIQPFLFRILPKQAFPYSPRLFLFRILRPAVPQRQAVAKVIFSLFEFHLN